ncbi:MAG: hypothetical protein JO022_02290 [Acidobacteriaceae bacterium]|nr:hypothetical protein [Acidobacteriaceae bacterium]
MRIEKLLFVIAVGYLALPAGAQECTTQTLRGSYGYSVSGTIVTATGPLAPGPFAAVGRITFDGRGGVQTVRSLSDNGNILRNDAGSGNYTINDDCTGSFSISVGPPQYAITLTLDIVLDDTGQLRGVVTTPGVVLLLEGRRQLSM